MTDSRRLARAWRVSTLLASWLACAIAAPSARAHDVSYAHLDLRWTRTNVRAALTVHQDDAALILRVPMPEWFLEQDFLDRAGPALADSLRRRWSVRAGETPLAFRFVSAARDPKGRGVQLLAEAALAAPAPELEVRGPLFPEIGGHETFLTVERDGRLLRQDVLDTRHPIARVFASGAPGTFAVLRTFVPAGIHHIAIGPDHILFVLGLLLLGGSLARLLKVITAFTLAHSLTLTLAALGVVHVPSRVVEPVIALSIVFVALETLRARGTTRDVRAWLAFLFGLVHGFGFASVLAEFGLPREALGWALAGFNLGVEIGQGVLVVMVAPLLAWLARRAPRAHARVIPVLAAGIALAGATWFVQRLLGAR